LPAPTRFRKDDVAVSADEAPLGTLADTLQLGQQLPGRGCVVTKPSLGVIMADQHLGDAYAEKAGSRLEWVEPQSP
jgi:hypothetical protein